jgi:hypothetical protein
MSGKKLLTPNLHSQLSLATTLLNEWPCSSILPHHINGIVPSGDLIRSVSLLLNFGEL